MAFEGCHNLTSITIPGSFTTSGKYAAFNNLLYEITGDSAKLLHVPGGLESVTIGEGLHIPVTSIGDYAFYDFHKLTNVTIPDSVTSIGEYGFFHCPNLTSITIPGSFTTSKRYAASNNLLYEIIDGSAKLLFVPRGLESVTIGEGLPIPVTSIESGTFSGCDKLTSITISDPVTSIGNYVFRGCRGLTSITIPDSVTSIGEGAFWGCENLTSVTIPGSVTIKGNIGENLFCGCRSLTSITIPGSFTTSRRYAASNNLLYEIIDGSAKLLYVPRGLESVTIGEGLPIPVTSIGCYAFCDWNSSKVRGDDAFRVYARSKDGGDDAFRDYNSSNHLTSVTIPNSVTSIDYCAFYNCHNLTSIKIPNSVTSIGSGAFKDCHNLGGIALPNSVTSIGSGAFKDCHNLEGIGLSNSVMHIDPTIFRGCDKLTRIAIPGLFTTSRKYAAFNNLLYEITGDSAKLLHVPAGLKSVFIGEGPFLVTSIGDCAFCGCRGLTSITIPDSVTSIGEEAFWRCESLRSIMIPDSVTSIGTWAFGGCENLTNIIIPGSFTTSGKYAAFNNLLYEIIDGSAKLLFVPKGLESVSIGEGLSFPVTSIGDYAFCSCQNLTNITIPDSVTSIGDCAFYGCGGLTSITIPASVTSIGDEAFYGCKSLTSATILDRE
jgi:hypothetical protein